MISIMQTCPSGKFYYYEDTDGPLPTMECKVRCGSCTNYSLQLFVSNVRCVALGISPLALAKLHVPLVQQAIMLPKAVLQAALHVTVAMPVNTKVVVGLQPA